MRKLLGILALVASQAFAQQTVSTTAVQTITGQKTFSGSDKLCLKDPSDTDKICFNAPALASSTVSLTTPATVGTLALSGADVAASQLTGTIAAARLPVMVGDSGSGGVQGAVPAPASGDAAKLLTGAGTWVAAGTGAVASISNSDGTLTISPTTGASVASLNLGHANTWTASQTFRAGTTTAGTAPFYMQTGPALTVPVGGAVEYGGDKLYITITTGPARKEIALRDSIAVTGGAVITQTAEGRLMENTGFTFGGAILTVPNLINSALTNGRVMIVGTSGSNTDDAGLAYDAANDRLMIGGPASTANRDVYLQKTVAGIVRFYVNNLSNGTTAQGGYTILNDATTSAMSMLTTSSGFTTAGLITAGDSYISNTGGNVMLMAGTAAKAVILAAGGTGTANEGLRIVSGMAVMMGYAIGSLPAGTQGPIAYVTDQVTACPVAGVAPTAGGALKCPVFYNGAAWVGG